MSIGKEGVYSDSTAIKTFAFVKLSAGRHSGGPSSMLLWEITAIQSDVNFGVKL